MHSALGRIRNKSIDKNINNTVERFKQWLPYPKIILVNTPFFPVFFIIASAWAEKLPASYNGDTSGLDPAILEALGC